MSGVKQRLFKILENNVDDGLLSKSVDGFLLALIVSNIIVVILESVASLRESYGAFFENFELISVAIFSAEYLSRMWICNMRQQFQGALGRIRYAITPMAIVDLLAVLPFYLPLFITFDLRMLRMFRLLRLLRLLKVARYSSSLRLFQQVYTMKKSELTMCFLAIMFMLVIASSLIFLVENEAQPEAFSSIPASMWWGVATLTTVGYGDITPITPVGKFIGSIIAILGIGLFALPAAVLGSGFVVAMRRQESSTFYCPHCSREIARQS